MAAKGKKKKSTIPARFYDRATLCHVVKSFKDGAVTVVVYKYWVIRRQYWVYNTITLTSFATRLKHELFTLKKDEQYKNQKMF